MADQIIKCRFLLQGPLHSNEPQAISLVAVQEFPSQLREQWHEAIIEHNVTSNEGCSSLQSFILDPNGAIEVKYDTMDSNTATPSADYVTLSAALAVLEVDEQVANLNPAGAIEVLHRMRQLGERIPLPVHHHAAAVFERMKDISEWIHANPTRAAGIIGGVTIFSLACATPAILGAVGFSAIGPVAGSAAAAWQASTGSVVAGSLFPFLQSAAMGGAAMGVFTGMGAAGAVVAIAAGLASPETQERVGEIVETVRGFSEGVVNEVTDKVKGFFGWS